MIVLAAALTVASLFPFSEVLNDQGKPVAPPGKDAIVLREPAIELVTELKKDPTLAVMPVRSLPLPGSYTSKLFSGLGPATLVNSKGRITKIWAVGGPKLAGFVTGWRSGRSLGIGASPPDPRAHVAALPKLAPPTSSFELLAHTLRLRFTVPGVSSDSGGLLVLFLSTSGAADGLYLERISECAKEAAKAGIGVLGLFPDYDETAAGVSAFGAAAGISFDIALDPGNAFADAYRATRTPEAFLLDADGRLVYTGAIDSSTWPDPSNRPFLMEAIKNMGSGQAPKIAKTLPFGTIIRRSSADESNG
jgi:hypothetical protein